jgi:hypothetical protein
MDEQRAGTDEPELRRPEDAIADLEPDEHEADAVVGGLKLDGIAGESQNDTFKTN